MRSEIIRAIRMLYFDIALKHVNTLVNIINPTFRYLVRSSLRSSRRETVPDSLDFTKGCIDKGIKWILFHQSLQPDGGVTSAVTFARGKPRIGKSYPEVTGYIIPTLFDYASTFGSRQAFDAAVKAADFELSLAYPDGCFPGGTVGRLTGPSVFNSAQVAHGLVRAYKETGEAKYIDSAVKACQWIKSVQQEDGAWGNYNYLGMKRTYDTKVCQALLETDHAVSSDEFRSSAERNLDFVLRNQNDNGWFANCDNSYERNTTPLTHTIGYTIQGLLVCHTLTNREDLLQAAIKPLCMLMHRFEIQKKPLTGRFYSNWRPAVTSSCITGDAQISLCWMEVYRMTHDLRYVNAALKMNDFLKRIQYHCDSRVVDGSFPGSIPFWGDYWAYSVNSWGVKYCIDALMQEYQIKREMIKEVES